MVAVNWGLAALVYAVIGGFHRPPAAPLAAKGFGTLHEP